MSTHTTLRDLFEAVLELPASDRAGYLDAHCCDAVLRERVEKMLASDARGNAALEQGAGAVARTVIVDAEPLVVPPAGSRVGPFELIEIIGEGGSSTVFRARRVVESVVQNVALKIMHRPLYSPAARQQFRRERQALTNLRHPGIARMIEGGVTESSVAYIALELVEGEPITAYARRHRLDVEARLRLFVDVCRAVDSAHRALIVHRDLKPSNVLVDGEGGVRVLDFGIAKLLDAEDETQTHLPAFTPAYAAPEQRDGGMITTATDVYALGIVLGEMLTGERFDPQTCPTPSGQVRDGTDAGVLPASASLTRRQLRGDLDNIVLKATDPEPERRYPSAAALADDIERFIARKPVAAHPPSPWYRTRKFVARHRGGVVTTAAFLLAIIASLGVALWQAHAARVAAASAKAESNRANATRDFLIGVFRASDPRIVHPKPRGEMTAKELLDANAPRISEEFAADPETELELLGVTAGIYAELEDRDRFSALHAQQIALARSLHGDLDPRVVDGELDEASAIITQGADAKRALATLDRSDAIVHRAALDESAVRARWWLLRGQALSDLPDQRDASIAALQKAVALYEKWDADNIRHSAALTFLGGQYIESDPAKAEELLVASLAAQAHARAPDDSLHAGTLMDLAMARVAQGKFDLAEHAYQEADDLFLRSRGESSWAYWEQVGNHALFVHQQGDRERADAMFEHVLTIIPADWHTNTSDQYVRELYGTSLAMEGRANEGIPLLERAEAAYQREQGWEGDLRRARLRLGDAYDRGGDVTSARRTLKAALDAYAAVGPADDPALLAARERWGRFALDRGETTDAKVQFDQVVSQAHARKLEALALAEGDLARLAMLDHHSDEALSDARQAIETFEHLADSRDVRDGPYLWLILADALRQSGDQAHAREWSERALEASNRYDAPVAPSIATARKSLQGAPKSG
jgi:eukaryotic-like serine/threonine-protein kinase